MSASPAGPPSGPASTTPNGGAPAPARRRRPPGNPFIQKKPARKPPGQGPFAAPRANGTPHGRPSTVNPQQSNGQPLATKAAPDPDDDPSLYSEYPLVATKKAILDGLRFHAMRLMTTGEANPYDPEQFTPPLRLHRRFPRDKMMDPEAAGLAVDSKDREKEEIRKAERQAEKEANQAQIAPTEKAAAAKKRPQFKKKIEDVFYPQDTPEAQKRSKLRYEEGRPWHLEDFDGKNSWVGTYEEPLSESHAMLVLDKNGNFRMVPLEKWYRFVPTGRYKTMDLDEAEKHMDKKVKASRWFLDNAQGVDQKRRADHERQQHQQRGRVGMRGEDRPAKTEDDDGERMDMANDIDEIDFEHDDEFQDDDEGKLIGGDEEEDVKDSERRIRQEMLGANIFAGTGVKEEKDWDEEEEREKKEAQEERKKAKRLRKNLIKREKKYEYESESDHPYSEESDSEDSETERQREEEEEKKKEEEKNAKITNGDKLISGAASSGTSTPSGRPEKRTEPLSRQPSAYGSLKRPGSPNLSEASGSESTHKRIKKQHRDANGHAHALSSSAPDGGRSLSPNAARKAIRSAGSGSDTEASGTERRPKLRKGDNSPPLSRSASPKPPSVTAAIVPSMPSAEQIRAAIPADGITHAQLIRLFRAQIPKASKEGIAAFIALVKQVGKPAMHDKSLIIQR